MHHTMPIAAHFVESDVFFHKRYTTSLLDSNLNHLDQLANETWHWPTYCFTDQYLKPVKLSGPLWGLVACCEIQQSRFSIWSWYTKQYSCWYTPVKEGFLQGADFLHTISCCMVPVLREDNHNQPKCRLALRLSSKCLTNVSTLKWQHKIWGKAVMV